MKAFNIEIEKRKVLEKHIEIICKKLVNEIKEIKSIVLYGGYGRGEGSWYKNEMGQWCPYNDYDLVVISPIKRKKASLSDIRECIARKIGIRWIDVSVKTPKMLINALPSIYNYDLKYASTTIYGDIDAQKLLPDYNSDELPLVEIETLFITRLWTLLGCINEDGLFQELSGESARFFRNQLAKSLLSVIDSILLTKRKYHYSYIERTKRVLDYNFLSLIERNLFQWALQEKLEPKGSDMKKEEVVELYKNVHQIYFKYFKIGLGEYFKKKINTIEELVSVYNNNPLRILKRLAYLFIRLNFKQEKRIAINNAQIYLASAFIDNNLYNNKYMRLGNSYLNKVSPDSGDNNSWDKARLTAARLRMIF